MITATKKWIFLKLSAVVMLPLMIWFVFQLVSIYDMGFEDINSFFVKQPNKFLFSLFVIITYFYSALSISEVFEDYHGVITPASTGVADKGLKFTGSPEFCTVWTYMGLPSISLPLLTGENNLPLGVQLVGNKLDDLRFLGVANWLEKKCKDDE